jgi:hypothetical protein
MNETMQRIAEEFKAKLTFRDLEGAEQIFKRALALLRWAEDRDECRDPDLTLREKFQQSVDVAECRRLMGCLLNNAEGTGLDGSGELVTGPVQAEVR